MKKLRRESCVRSNKTAAKSLCLSDLFKADLQMSCLTATKYFGSFAEPLVKSIRTNYCSKLAKLFERYALYLHTKA